MQQDFSYMALLRGDLDMNYSREQSHVQVKKNHINYKFVELAPIS
jgi:hypothetical protein